MEIIANAVQTVGANQNVYFTDSITPGTFSIQHRNASGFVNLLGTTNQCRARFKVAFYGNIGLPSTGTAGPISLAIAIDGEVVPSTTMIMTPTAVSTFFHVSSALFVDVPRGTSVSVSVKNAGDESIDVQNANLIVERVA